MRSLMLCMSLLLLFLATPAHAVRDFPTPPAFSIAEWRVYVERGQMFARQAQVKYQQAAMFGLEKKALLQKETRCLTLRMMQLLVEHAAYDHLAPGAPIGKRIEHSNKVRDIQKAVREACEDGSGGGRGVGIADEFEKELKQALRTIGRARAMVRQAAFVRALTDLTQAAAYGAFLPQLLAYQDTMTLLSNPEKASPAAKKAAGAVLMLTGAAMVLNPGAGPATLGAEVFGMMPIPQSE